MDPENIQILPLHATVRRVGSVAASALVAIALIIMAGWQLRIPILRGQVFGSFVAPNSALCFLLCGVSLLLQTSNTRSPGSKFRLRIGMGLGAAVGVFGLLTLGEHLTGIDLNIDRLFFAHRMGDWWLPNPGRIAITSSIAFLVGGLGLLFIRRQGKTFFISDIAGCAVLGVAYIGIIGYMFGFRLFYGRVMAMPTAILFAVMGVAMLCCSSAGWVIQSLANPRLGGLLVRRLTAAILFAVPALGLLETWVERRRLLTPESGMALLMLAVVALFTTLVLRTAAVMNSIDENRDTAQQRATALSEELSALIEASPVGIIRFRQDRTVASWSGAAERMLGWKAEEIIGRQLPIAPNSAHDWSELVAKLAGGASLVHVETRQVRKDGSIMEALVSGAPIRNAAGVQKEFIGVIADSTELKLAKEALIRTEKLSAAGRLAASIAHEINNPLEAVTNLLYLARSSRDQTQEFLALADEELARVTYLTKQTLGFYREDGAPAGVNISALAEGVLNIYQSKLKGKQMRVVKDLRAETKLSTVAGEVRQVLSNLIANAIDAAPAQGVITIRTKSAHANGTGAPGIQVTVADNGTGIDAAIKNKIWEPFFTTKKDVGTGLGLWVSKQIIEKHGGSIRFRSSRRGTLFMVFLPSLPATQSSRVSA